MVLSNSCRATHPVFRDRRLEPRPCNLRGGDRALILLPSSQLVSRRLFRAAAVLHFCASPGIAQEPIEDCATQAKLPIAIRAFGPQATDSLTAQCGQVRQHKIFELAPSWAVLWVNTARASAISEGPIWLGRGVTFGASTGLLGRWGVLSYSLRPIGFWSQNLSYSPSRSIVKEQQDYTDPWIDAIDRPYRFGEDAYARLDAGDSYLRVDTRWIGVGASNARQIWGPARLQPLVLGSAAASFPHLFVETGLPIPIGIGRISTRWIAGQLTRSGYRATNATRRLGVGAIASFTPASLDGLELGAARFFHVYDVPEARNWATYTLPFRELFTSATGNVSTGARTYNQLASVFIRIAPILSPFEAYGEFARDDHWAHARDAIAEPDHISAFLIGLRHSTTSEGVRHTLTLELTNGRLSHLARVRGQTPVYTHALIAEGHTHRGLPLGSPALVGGGGLELQWVRRSASDTWTATAGVLRLAQNVEGGTWNGKATGYYSVGLGRETFRWHHRWNTAILLQPGFGDVPGVNFAVVARVER